jgi:hypothetical protein
MINPSILKKVLIVGTTLLLAAGGSKADDPFDPSRMGGHNLVVNTSPGIQSIYVTGIWGSSPLLAEPEDKAYYRLNPNPGWHDVGYLALNGTQLQVITFTSNNCTDGYTAKRVLTVPYNDGLRKVWVDASQPDPWPNKP